MGLQATTKRHAHPRAPPALRAFWHISLHLMTFGMMHLDPACPQSIQGWQSIQGLDEDSLTPSNKGVLAPPWKPSTLEQGLTL